MSCLIGRSFFLEQDVPRLPYLCRGLFVAREGGHTQRGPQHVRLPVSRAKSTFDLLNSQDFDLFSRGQVRNGLEKPLTCKPDG